MKQSPPLIAKYSLPSALLSHMMNIQVIPVSVGITISTESQMWPFKVVWTPTVILITSISLKVSRIMQLGSKHPITRRVLLSIQKYAPMAYQAFWVTLSKKTITTTSSTTQLVNAMGMISLRTRIRPEIYLFILKSLNIQFPTFDLMGHVIHTSLILAHWICRYKLDPWGYWLLLEVSLVMNMILHSLRLCVSGQFLPLSSAASFF